MKKTGCRSRLAAGIVAALTAVGFAAPAASHHSFAMYDRGTTKTVTGKLTRFIPGANHAQLIFELVGDDGQPVIGPDGKPAVWGVETGPAGQIAREGVTVDSFPLGTIITVSLNPLRDGRPFGVLAAGGIVKCGMKMPEGGCTAQTGDVFMLRND